MHAAGATAADIAFKVDREQETVARVLKKAVVKVTKSRIKSAAKRKSI